MAHGWIRTRTSALAQALLAELQTRSYHDALRTEDIHTFDLGSIPEETNVDEDLAVVANLLRAEAGGGGVLYVGTPTRNLVLPGIEVMDRGDFGVFDFVGSGPPSLV